MMYEFRTNNPSESDSDYDIPIPNVGRATEKRDHRGDGIDNLVSSTEDLGSDTSTGGGPDANEKRSRSPESSERNLGGIALQQLQVGEMTAALLGGAVLRPQSSSPVMTSSGHASSGGTQTTRSSAPIDAIKIKALGRTFRSSNPRVRELLKRKALTLPHTVRYDVKTDQFHVDCSAEVFEEVFDYFRTGDLHLPKKVCIEKSIREMRRINVFPNMLSPCCFARYDRFRAQKEAMKIWYEQLVKDPSEGMVSSTPSKTPSLRMRIWSFLENPFSSKYATAYSWITIIMVALSITGFVVETLPQIEVVLDNFKFVRSFSDLVIHCGQMSKERSAARNLTLNFTTTTAPPTPSPCMHQVKHQGNIQATPTDCYMAVTLWFIDYLAAAFFTLDVLIRFVVAPSKLGFFKSRLNLVDALALVPFYVELFFSLFTQIAYNKMWEVLEVFRSLRLLRIFRLAKWNYGLNVLYYTARAIVGPMSTLLTICVIAILFFGTLMYYVDTRDRFTSIPLSIYWAAITMTTVGYGDITPESSQGYLIAALCASCGILVIGFVLPIVTSKFMFYYQHIKMGRYYKKIARQTIAASSSQTSLETSSKKSIRTAAGRQNKSDAESLLPPSITVTGNETSVAKTEENSKSSIDKEDDLFVSQGDHFVPRANDEASGKIRIWTGAMS